MGNVFRRQKGRSWLLRETSMALWPKWIEELQSKTHTILLKKPLVLIANSEEEKLKMQNLAKERSRLGVKELMASSYASYRKEWPNSSYGGLISENDGQIDPGNLLNCILEQLKEMGVKLLSKKAIKIKRNSSKINFNWKIILEDNSKLILNKIIICAAKESELLLGGLGHKIALEQVLGQAIELEVITKSNLKEWPGVISFGGINLIPKGSNRIWLGATLEKTNKPDLEIIDEMRDLKGKAPDWLKNAKIKRHWYGKRCKPLNQPAPILEEIEPGLILATGHYRNGILLAPATAEWVGNKIS